ncbi:MAG: hypothetical protein WC959_01465 [Kiritimatiellales bacterium]
MFGRNIIELSSKTHKQDFQRLRAVVSCVSTDIKRMELNCVHVTKEENGILVTAVDGVRLRSDRFLLKTSPGAYGVKINNTQRIVLVKLSGKVKCPEWRRVVPSTEKADAYAIEGIGKHSAVWASAALGYMLNPAMVALTDEEKATLLVPRDKSSRSPVVLKNEKTLYLQMPVRVNEKWIQTVEQIKSKAA